MNMRKVAQAITALLLITSASSTMAPAQVNVEQGLMIEQQHKYTKARHIYTAVLENNPQNAQAHFRLGLLDLRQFKNIDSAVKHLKAALELDGQNAEYHFILAEAYAALFIEANIFMKIPLMNKARQHLERATQLNPDNVLYIEGLIQYFAYVPRILGGSKKKAHLLADSMEHIDAYAGLLSHAGIYSFEGEKEQAVMFYQKAIDLNPVDGRGYYRFGYFYLDEKQYEEAITQFKKYVEVAPDSAESHHSLGEAFFSINQYREASNSFLLALRQDPRNTSSIYRLAQCYEHLNSYEEALQHYKKYVELVPAGSRVDNAREKIFELSTDNH